MADEYENILDDEEVIDGDDVPDEEPPIGDDEADTPDESHLHIYVNDGKCSIDCDLENTTIRVSVFAEGEDIKPIEIVEAGEEYTHIFRVHEGDTIYTAAFELPPEEEEDVPDDIEEEEELPPPPPVAVATYTVTAEDAGPELGHNYCTNCHFMKLGLVPVEKPKKKFDADAHILRVMRKALGKDRKKPCPFKMARVCRNDANGTVNHEKGIKILGVCEELNTYGECKEWELREPRIKVLYGRCFIHPDTHARIPMFYVHEKLADAMPPEEDIMEEELPDDGTDENTPSVQNDEQDDTQEEITDTETALPDELPDPITDGVRYTKFFSVEEGDRITAVSNMSDRRVSRIVSHVVTHDEARPDAPVITVGEDGFCVITARDGTVIKYSHVKGDAWIEEEEIPEEETPTEDDIPADDENTVEEKQPSDDDASMDDAEQELPSGDEKEGVEALSDDDKEDGEEFNRVVNGGSFVIDGVPENDDDDENQVDEPTEETPTEDEPVEPPFIPEDADDLFTNGTLYAEPFEFREGDTVYAVAKIMWGQSDMSVYPENAEETPPTEDSPTDGENDGDETDTEETESADKDEKPTD